MGLFGEFITAYYQAIRRTLVLLYSLNIILCIVLALYSDRLANDEVDKLKPPPENPDVIKKTIFVSIMVAGVLAILVNILGVVGAVKEAAIALNIYLVLSVVGVGFHLYRLVTNHKANLALHWFYAVWSVVILVGTVVFWVAIKVRKS